LSEEITFWWPLATVAGGLPILVVLGIISYDLLQFGEWEIIYKIDEKAGKRIGWGRLSDLISRLEEMAMAAGMEITIESIRKIR